MKILQVNTVVNSGSTGRIAEDIGKLAIERDWESYIAYGRGIGNSSSHLIKIGSTKDIVLHGARTRIFDQHGFGSLNSSKKLVNNINVIKPDLIHLHNLHGYYINIAELFKSLSVADIPVIWTLHDCWAFTGHCAYFDSIGCNKWKTQCFNCPQLKSYPKSYFMDRSLENFRAKKSLFTSLKNLIIVPVSLWLESLVRESFFSETPIHVIHNGIDVSKFSKRHKLDPELVKRIKGKFVILGVSIIWNDRKGLETFIQLNKQLDSSYQIILVGLSSSQLKQLPPGIIGLPKTESIDGLAGLYSISDVFINPTIEDNFPTTNLESMACGTPVITYNTGGSGEAISEKTGYVIQKNDLNGLIKAIRAVKDKGKDHYSKNCVETVMKRFNKDIKFQEYFDLYTKIVET